MQLTKHTDISLRVLMYLAIHADETIKIARLSEVYKESNNHMIKIVHQLVKAGYVQSIRGRSGGVKLAREAAAIKVSEVIKTTERHAHVVDCVANTCPLQSDCKLQHALDQASIAFFATLDNFSVADISQNAQQIRVFLGE